MNSIILKILSLFPQVSDAFKVLEWLLAETGYWQKVATWLAAENEWYFKLAAIAWGELYVAKPDALKPVLLAEAAKGGSTDQSRPGSRGGDDPTPPSISRRPQRWW